MRCFFTMLAVVLACLCPGRAHGQLQSDIDLDELNAKLSGVIVDYTHNHGRDNRIESAILCQPRDLYVYLPPCYDPAGAYPLVIWCHGAFGDEHAFLDTAQIEYLDPLLSG